MVQIVIDSNKCLGEGICRAVCPKGGRIYKIVELDGKRLAVVMDESSCLGCKLCMTRCPHDAIRIDFKKRSRFRDVEF
nr:ferredoxin family protein [Candidatus Freyarchaeota archaeon]